MIDSFSKVIQALMIIIFIYAYQRRENRKSNIAPRLKAFESIFSKYYEIYFFRFKSIGIYPHLLEIYKDMAQECQNYNIDSKILKKSLEMENSEKNGGILSFFYGFIVFMGATQLSNFLKTVEELKSFFKNIDFSQLDMSFFSFESFETLLPYLSIFVVIVVFLFFLRVDNKSNVIKYSKASQMKFIIADFSDFYENINNNNTNKVITDTLLVSDFNKTFFDISITQLKDEIKMYIPNNLSKEKKTTCVTLQDSDKCKNITLILNNEDEYVFNFQKNNSWKLSNIETKNGHSFSENEFQKIVVIFDILFEEAKENYNNRGKFLSFFTNITNFIYSLKSKFIKFIISFFVTLVLSIFMLGLIVVLIFMLDNDLIYLIFIIYICFSISSWLLKNVH